MRLTLTLFFFMSLYVVALAQDTCCNLKKSKAHEVASEAKTEGDAAATPSATAQFALFAHDADFRAAHAEPKPYTHQTTRGKEISFETPDGKTARAFAYMASRPSKKYLLVIHEWWGLNDHIKREAERYYKEVYNTHVLALDLYDGKVATTREEAQQYVQGASEERIRAIIQGALNYAGPDARIATIGWCFGGGWSLQAALQAQKRATACVIYYGMPEQDVQKLRQLHCEVLGIFASKDARITPQVVETFQQNMEKADKELEVKMYEAQHAFANPSNPYYDKVAADNAFKFSSAFLKKHLK